MQSIDDFLGLGEADGTLYFDLTKKRIDCPKVINDILDPG